jgi:ParB-like chromosome segregation protein Spo0J
MTDIKLERVLIDNLTPDPENARLHDKRNIEAIAGSLSRFGQRKPIVISGNNVIVAGNGTVTAAKHLGWTEVVAVRVPQDWSPEQIKAYALADNRTAELAEWDARVLADQLIELDGQGWAVEEFGFLPLSPDIVEDPFSLLKDDERKDATQMTFTLTLDQGEIVKACITAAIKSGKIPEISENTNRNGNALFLICSEWSNDLS